MHIFELKGVDDQGKEHPLVLRYIFEQVCKKL